MCPSHLIEEWKEEIENNMPLSEAVIVSSLKEFLALKSRIRDPKRYHHLFVIMSKEIAKNNYELRPAAIWSESKKCFVCPNCGKPLYTKDKKSNVQHFFTETSFLKLNNDNDMCMNSYSLGDKDGGMSGTCVVSKCNHKLWTSMNRTDSKGWIKIGSGWILEKHLDKVYDSMFENIDKLDKKGTKLLEDISIARQQIHDKKFVVRAPRTFPIARYIREHFKDCLDYVILDEAHQLKGEESAQGLAAADLINTAKRTLLLTGTLLNGYASGIYHLFFRCFPKQMIREGFGFHDSSEFQKKFGVSSTIVRSTRLANGMGSRPIGTSVKELPGISPIVFTKFMLENSLFIGMDDISEGLPNYKEIPVSVQMEPELRAEYNKFESAMRMNATNAASRASAQRVSIQYVQGLLIYSDQPFDQPPITDYETDQILYQPIDLDRDHISNKEQALLDIVHDKKYLGEKVLLYYSWTGRTQLDKKFIKLFKDNDIKAVLLDNKVKPRDRQSWIEQQVRDGADVVICNPKKVETGLNLLDFTTIIFYQTGNDPYTLRQASRRSWRLSQTKDVEVYFMYYQNTVQETLLNMMATKIQASMAIEGKFSEEGLNAMSQNEDFLTQIANSVVKGISETIDMQVFQKITRKKKDSIRIDRPLSIYRAPSYPSTLKIEEKRSVPVKHSNTLSVFNYL